jgi:hypothetical protein
VSTLVQSALKTHAVPQISLQESPQCVKHFEAHTPIMQMLVLFAELKIADHEFRVSHPTNFASACFWRVIFVVMGGSC